MIDKLTAIYSRYEQLEEQLGNPDLVSDLSRYKKVNKEYKDLKPLIECYLIYADIIGNINTSQEMLKDNDFDMRQMAHEELSVLLPQKLALEEQIKMLLIPKDPADSKNVILEIRSVQVVTKRPFLLRISFACTQDIWKTKAGKQKFSM